MNKIAGGLMVALALCLFGGTAEAAQTRIAGLQVSDYTWMKGSGYTLTGVVGSPNKQCRKVKRTVVIRNLTRGKNLGRGVSDPIGRGQFVVDTRPVKSLIMKGDRIRVTVQKRKAGSVTCAAATRVFPARISSGGAG